jgi:exopolysaccharide biosynthesis polyprenyl glycosylphosphotransferase
VTTNASAPTASNEATLQRDVEASRVIVPEAEAAPVIVSGAEAPLTIVPEAEASPVIVPDIKPAPSQSDAETPPSRAETATRPISRQFRALYLAMGVTDVLCTTAAVLLADWIRFRFGIAHPPFLKSLLVTPIVVGSVFHAFGLYRVHQLAPAEEFRRVVMGVTVTIGALVLAAFWYQAQLSRSWIGLSWALALVAVLSARQGWRKYLGRARRGGRFCFRTLIVGDDEQAEHISRLLEGGAYGFRPLGLVSTSSDPPAASSVLGHVRDLRDLVRKHQADSVFVSSSSTSPKDMQFVSKIARVEGLELRVAANLPEVLTSRLAVQPVGGLPTLSLKPVELSGAQAAAKRMFDIVGAAGLLALGIPLWLLITAAVKFSSRGPVLFRQQRVGRRGAPFTLLKFRTMVPDAEAMLSVLRERNEGSGPLFKLRDDPRVTRVGKWLRRWSLDETPQLINVLRGDMSLVGPRPPLPEEVAAYELWQADRLEVRPGITGLWQVSGRSQLSFDDYVRLDLFYIENWSLTYDIFICAKTLPILLSGRGAY